MIRFYSAASTFGVAPLLAALLSAPLSAETLCDAAMMRGSIAQISETHATVDTSVLINAPTSDVWTTLTDFEAMADRAYEELPEPFRTMAEEVVVRVAGLAPPIDPHMGLQPNQATVAGSFGGE